MKLLMLCREPRLYSCQRLKEAAESCGHQMDILDPNRCILKLDKNQPHFSLYYQQNAESELYLLPDYDAVLPRFGTTSTQMGCAVLRHFQGKGVYCLNEEQAFLAARDKWRSLQMLLEQSIAVPNSVLSGCEVEPKQAIKQTTAPMIIKTLKRLTRYWGDLGGTSTKCGQYFRNVKRCECACLVTRFYRRGKRNRYSLLCDR